MRSVELLAPAGSVAALEAALRFGADAVYIGGNLLQLRARSAEFTEEGIASAAKRAHSLGKRLYVTVNAVANNDEIELLPHYANTLKECGVDAVIVSDLGVLTTIHRACPDLELHVSTQASCSNYASAITYYELGAKRIVLARELDIEQIRQLRRKIPADLELEAFVHGAMCMAYSGRCILSSALLGRSGNRGDCAQPCRWSYAIVEESRPNQSFPIIEAGNQTMLLSSRDLNCIALLDELKDAGIRSFKIEGRMKTEYYVAVVTNAYRQRMNGTMSLEECKTELETVSHRSYTTGFYHGELPTDHSNAGTYTKTHTFVGTVLGYADGMLTVEQRNRFAVGDTLEIISPNNRKQMLPIHRITSEDGEPISVANRVKQILKIPCPFALSPNDLLRRRDD